MAGKRVWKEKRNYYIQYEEVLDGGWRDNWEK